MKLRETTEDYLETILIISNDQKYVRSVDIANKRFVTRACVSYAIKNLKKNGFITVDKNNMISLTAKGNKIAKEIYDRHKLLTNFFISLGVSKNQARIDACKLEHDISKETLSCIKSLQDKHYL